MEKIRVAGIIFINDGIALMHRTNVVKRKDIQNYYTFPGGGVENGENLEEATVREIKEEFGINVEVVKKLYEIESQRFNQKEVFFLCKYINGEFGTGDGDEFSNNPEYADSGKYTPEIINIQEIKNILLLPQEIKDKLIQDICNKKI